MSKLLLKLTCVMSILTLLTNNAFAFEFQRNKAFHDLDLSDWSEERDWYDENNYPYCIGHWVNDLDGTEYEYFNCDDENDLKIKSKEIAIKIQNEKDSKKPLNKEVATELNAMPNETTSYTEAIQNQNDESKNVGWVLFNNFWYYQDEKGNNKKEWQYIGDKWYYLDPETYIMVTGLRNINGNYYYFNNDGSMAVSKEILINDIQYYADANGRLSVNNASQKQNKSSVSYSYTPNGQLVISFGSNENEFFNYSFGASGLNSLRDGCLYWIKEYKSNPLCIVSLRGAIDNYVSYLNTMRKVDTAYGNQEALNESKKAFAEINEWYRTIK